MTFNAAKPTFAAPARSPDARAIFMTSQVFPKTSFILTKADLKSEAMPFAASAQMSHAPVNFQTTAIRAPSATPTKTAGLEIAVHIAIATTLTPIITALRAVKMAINPFTAAIGASTATFKILNAVLNVPTAKATALNASPRVIKAAPAASNPAIILTAVITTPL